MFVVEELPKNKKMFVHVVDENFRIVYSDEDIEKNSSEGEAGRLCYELYGGEKTQCRSCPLREENKGKSIIFNRVQNEWTSVSSVPIEMPNVGKCYVITTETINNNGNTFLNHSEDWIYGKKCFFPQSMRW